MSYAPANWPHCAKCGRPVEKLERDDDVLKGVLRWAVYCHGEREVAEVDMRDIVESIDGQVRAGVAFRPAPALPGASV